MSNLEQDPTESACGGVALAEPSPASQTMLPREVPLGGPRGIVVRRTLPHRAIRTVGAWCFVDHYGPISLSDPTARGMVVPPHPHIGLQTVTWLLAGEVEHRDSVGSHQVVRPGQLNLMTAGRGIAHSEYSLPVTGRLFGIQLWVALTEQHRDREPSFEHHAVLPHGEQDGVAVTGIMGDVGGLTSPASTYSPLVAAEIRLPSGTATVLPVERDFEYAVLVADGGARVAGEAVPSGALRYLGWGTDAVHLASDRGGTLLLLGGEPLAEHLLMWWNFVGRDHDEIAAARADWEAGRRFGTVPDDPNPRIPAPALPTVRMRPRPPRASP